MERRTVKVSAIKIDATKNARKNLEKEEGSIDRLALDIKTNGLLNDPIVRDLENGTYELRAGNRRMEAIKRLEWEEVTVKVMAKDSNPRLAALADNVDREDLSLYEIAAEVAEIAREQNLSGSQIARGSGMSVSHVNNLLRMMSNLPKIVKDDWKSGHPMATRETLGKLAAMTDKETKKPDHARMAETWGQLIGADEGSEGDASGGESSDEEKEEKIKPVSAKKAATRLIDLIVANGNPKDISAMESLQYVVGARKSLPRGLKEVKE